MVLLPCPPCSLSDAPSLLSFLCLKNIRTFLKVCHDKFGLRNSELFDPFDLFDVRDFGKVSGLFLERPDPSGQSPVGGCRPGCVTTGGGASGLGLWTAPPAFSGCSE